MKTKLFILSFILATASALHAQTTNANTNIVIVPTAPTVILASLRLQVSTNEVDEPEYVHHEGEQPKADKQPVWREPEAWKHHVTQIVSSNLWADVAWKGATNSILIEHTETKGRKFVRQLKTQETQESDSTPAK